MKIIVWIFDHTYEIDNNIMYIELGTYFTLVLVLTFHNSNITKIIVCLFNLNTLEVNVLSYCIIWMIYDVGEMVFIWEMLKIIIIIINKTIYLIYYKL